LAFLFKVIINDVRNHEPEIYYLLCLSLALGIPHAMRLRNILICGMPRPNIFLQIISLTVKIFRKKKTLFKTKRVF